jgi:predicted nucleotidyltransferase
MPTSGSYVLRSPASIPRIVTHRNAFPFSTIRRPVLRSKIYIELFGNRVRVIGIEDLIAAKEALGREKDLLAAKELRAILERTRS